jgi:hypothetical protein
MSHSPTLSLSRLRAAAKTRNKLAKSPLVSAKNCETVILFLDKIEELRPLSPLEFHLRVLIKLSLHNGYGDLLAATCKN